MTANMHAQTCKCGRPTRDAAYVCDDCADLLARSLGDIPWLDEQLDVTVTRSSGIDYRTLGGAKATESPSPVHWAASEARTHLKALLVSWVLWCSEERVRNSDPTTGLPADNLIALSRWMLWRVDGLALHDIGGEAVSEIADAVQACHRLIDRHPERQYLGPCEACESGRVYARPGSKRATCDACDASTDAEAVRAKLLASLDDRLCTAAEIARLSTYLGLQAGREQVRKRINQWHSRDQIETHAAFSDEPAFRFGEVYAMLVGDEYARKASA
jgi:hypothetical protein